MNNENTELDENEEYEYDDEFYSESDITELEHGLAEN